MYLRSLNQRLTALALAAAFACLGPEAFAREITVQLKWLHQFQFAGYYAAQMEGYFEEAGLEVTLVEGGAGVDAFAAVAAGEADFAIAASDLLERRLQGEPVVAVATFYQHSPYVLISTEDSGIERLEDLQGKRIAVSGKTLPAELLGMLAAVGLEADDYTIVPSSSQVEDLLAGKVEAISGYTTDQPFRIREAGLAPLIFNPFEHGVDFYGDSLFCSESFAARYPRVVTAFRDAVVRGWQFALDNPAAVNAYILELESARATPLTIETLEFEFSQSRQLLLPGLVDLGHMSRSRWQRMADTMVVIGRAEMGYSLDGFLFNPPPRSTIVLQVVVGVLILTLLTLAAMALILLWNRQLRRQVGERTEALRMQTQVLEQEILERRQAELKLQRLVDIIEATTDFIGMCDVRGFGAYLNATGRRMLGIGAQEDITALHFLSIHPQREHERFQEEILPQVHVNGYWLGEMAIVDRTGKEISTSQLIVGHRDREGHVQYFSTIARDITQQKQQEKALRESRRTLLTLISNLPGMVYRSQNDRDWTMEFVSEGCRELTGYEPEELIGNAVTSIGALTLEEDREQVWETVQQALETRKPFQLMYRILTKEGEIRWIGEQGRGVFTKRGHFVAIEGFMTDITQQRNAEEAMTRLRLYLKSVIDSMPSILVAVDKDGRVTHWNLEAEERTGIPAEEAQHAAVVDVLPLLKTEMHRIREAIELRRPIRSERRKVALNDQKLSLEFMVYPLMASGIEGAVIRVDDITQRLRLEEMMVQTEKMMLVGGLAAGMAHEINNPLGGIVQALNNIRRRCSTTLPDNETAARNAGMSLVAMERYFELRKINVFLDHITEACDRAARIVSDMLAFSRAGETSFESTDIAQLINTAIRWAHNDIDLRQGSEGTAIQVLADCDPEIGAIDCDPAKIQQVLLNLIRNAVQAHQSAPASEHPYIKISACRDGGQLTIEVRDNGPGMSEEACRHAFEPFYTTKEVGVGTGLGLSVSYFLIVDQHQGSIEVQSEMGSGARFIIRLPVKQSRMTG